jgi:hypothetical protein
MRVELRRLVPDRQQHVLHHVVGRAVAQPAADQHRLQPGGEMVEQLAERLLVAPVAHRQEPAGGFRKGVR